MDSSVNQSENDRNIDGNTSSQINYDFQSEKNRRFSLTSENIIELVDHRFRRSTTTTTMTSPASVSIEITDQFECPICCFSTSVERSELLSCCSLRICSDCFMNNAITLINQSKAAILCPSCSQTIDSMIILNKTKIPLSVRERYQQILAQNLSDHQKMNVKLCPHCNFITILDENDPRMKEGRSTRRNEQWIVCDQCNEQWCWPCYSPSHPDVSCRDFKKNQLGVDVWAKRNRADRPGQRNAQRCPKCSIYIEKIDGCDHMLCSKCQVKFCYRCGSRMMLPLWIGHDAKYSVFGCKYKLLPDQPCLRWFIRGSIFTGILLLAPIVLVLVVALAALALPFLLIFGIFFLPVYVYTKYKK